VSSYTEDYGKYGSDPSDKIGKFDSKNVVFKSALTHGTTKATNHIPGYQGFLATNTANPRVARVEMGGTMRSVDKTNLTNEFHVNLLGYSGHKPQNPNNDKGGYRPSALSTMGRDFRPPPVVSDDY
jgi:hypothetical protein